MNSLLPFSAEAASAVPVPNARLTASAAAATPITRLMAGSPLARLRPDIDQRRLARLDHVDRPLQRRRKLLRVLDRAEADHAQRRGEFAVVDVGRLDRGANRTRGLAER